jgi:NAD(P)-dependent dehydrogenase (short-subunit alcohol dehydrogenase family)|tara:strand:- start:670 stop:1419 length:750 start_codon:yes stop_codon:yes gene_type:complete
MTLPKNYQAQQNTLKEKVILVSGGGSGIGKTAGLIFAEHGADLILLGKDKISLESTYEEFLDRNLKPPLLHIMDLGQSTESNFREINNVIEKEFGKLDGLLNNAGILGDKTPLENYKIDVWKKVFDINVHASFLLTKSLLPVLKAAENSSIIFTSSGVGKVGKAYWGAYSLTKFATESMMQIFSEELENTSNIRVNSIDPGPVRTKMRAAAYPAEDPFSLVNAEDIMNAYLYLMSNDSLETNGESIAAQ